MNARCAIETATGAPGAVAVIRITTDDADAFFAGAGVRPVPEGRSGVRRVFGVDEALVARPDARTVLIMPHGGPAITRLIVARLSGLGIGFDQSDPDDAARYPESGDPIEGAMLGVLARAASPLAVDLLLDQPRRWKAHRPGGPLADAGVLGRLIDPPIVVAAGEPNIGKSSLLNAIAGGSVALAFDRPGTTRDAVGALVDMGGLVVRWVDTPGIGPADSGAGPDPIASAAAEAGRRALETADLVLWCADAGGAGPAVLTQDGAAGLVVATRCDRRVPGFEADVRTSATTGEGLRELGAIVREALVPGSVLADPNPWRFWGDGAVGA